jgi:hypothetical protein
MPRFSVVVPTRDRPKLLDFCLESLAGQTFADVEVIVSDNPVEKPARAVFDQWARPSWRYLRPGDPLPMHENFERACAEASGEYVAVVIDKTVLQPSALEFANRALTVEPSADIVTWWNEGYDPVDEERDIGQGVFRPGATAVAPAVYEARAELAVRFANATRRGLDPVHYVRGKIVFGAYSAELLDRIREHTGRLFHPLAPDYTAMVPASVLSRGAIDVGRPLLVSYNSRRSNGRLQSLDPAYARRFIEAVDPAIIEALPIPGLYTSTHNVVAYDLVSAAARCPGGTTPTLDLANLARRAREDLDAVDWNDSSERAAQYAILEAAELRAGVTPVPSEAPTGIQRLLGRTVAHTRALIKRAPETPPTYESPVEAARVADRYYDESLGPEYALPR